MAAQDPLAAGEDDSARSLADAHGGDPWAALAAAGERIRHLEMQLDAAAALVSAGYARRPPGPTAPAAQDHAPEG